MVITSLLFWILLNLGKYSLAKMKWNTLELLILTPISANSAINIFDLIHIIDSI